MHESSNIKQIDTNYNDKSGEWTIIINGKEYRINTITSKKGECDLYLNQKHIVIPKSSKIRFVGFDHTIEIDGRKIHCVLDGDCFDVAVQGKYIKSQKNYIPLKAVFSFTIVMVILLVAELFLIMTNTMTMPLFIVLLGIVFANIAYRDYVVKKAMRE